MILVTGGAGYIGSHTCVALLTAGYDVLLIDDFSNSSVESIHAIYKITGKKAHCIRADVCDRKYMDKIFELYPIDSVIHFAGYKSVGESVRNPLKYYTNNITATLTLCQTMQEAGVENLIFSSSATVYRANTKMPFHEESAIGCTNPYGWSKLMSERILTDLIATNFNWRIAILRYFNPIGAHESGIIGENPSNVPNNLFPYICRVASQQLEKLHIFGNDYPTIDGTGVRDYVHVMDVAEGHIKALEHIKSNRGITTFNLGTGKGTSVLELIRAFEEATDKRIPYVFDKRRVGDIAVYYASTDKAEKELKWKAKYDLHKMCSDGWNYEKHRICG